MDDMKWRNLDKIFADLTQKPRQEEPPEMPAQPEECACEPADICISLAIAYVPMQRWCDTYEPEVGLCRGTIFPELDKPFIGEVL